jgi:hypothetical protein
VSEPDITNHLLACANAARDEERYFWAKVMTEACQEIVNLRQDLENNRKINELLTKPRC